MKRQKEEFNVTGLKLQERITILELQNDDLEQYRCRVCVKGACLDIPVSCIDRAHYIGSDI